MKSCVQIVTLLGLIVVRPEKLDVAWIDPGYVQGDAAHSIASTIGDMQYFECLGKVHRMPTSLPTAGRNKLVEAFLYDNSRS